MRDRHAYHLARTLALVYALLVIYASLHPLAGWRASGVDLLDFVLSPWPRYFTAFDLAVNVAAYIPLGFLAVPALRSGMKPGWSVILAVGTCILLSLGLEVLQNFLPSRVPSNVDWGCNSVGGLAGALAGARWGNAFADRGWLARWRSRRIVRGRRGDLGLILIGGWLLTQLTPAGMFLGTGDLRALLDLASPIDYSAQGFLVLEMSIATCGIVSAGLIARQNLREPSPWLIALMFVMVVVARSLSAAILDGVENALQWLTPGSLDGSAIGILLLILALHLPVWLQRVLAALALLAVTVLVNLAPENPYAVQSLGLWQAGQFLNFYGLTRLVSLVWPFAALAYLMTLAPPTERVSS